MHFQRHVAKILKAIVIQKSLHPLHCSGQNNSPPSDLELIDRTLAVIVIYQVFITHPNTLMIHSYPSVRQVCHNTVQKVINISYSLPRSKRYIYFAVMFKQLRLAFTSFKT